MSPPVILRVDVGRLAPNGRNKVRALAAAYAAHHGHDPGPAPTLRSFLAVAGVEDSIWAARASGPLAVQVTLAVAIAAARRAVAAAGGDPAAEAKLDAAAADLDVLRATAREVTEEWGAARRPPTETLNDTTGPLYQRRYYEAIGAAVAVDQRERHAARRVWAVAEGTARQLGVARVKLADCGGESVVADYGLATLQLALLVAKTRGGSGNAECGAQRADFLAALERLEGV